MSENQQFVGDLKIIEAEKLSTEQQEAIKDGKALEVTRYFPDVNDRMIGSEGRIIWNGKYFLFIPEKVKPLTGGNK